MTRRYNERASASLTLRSRAEVTRFFDGLELVEPGVVPLSQWWRDGSPAAAAAGPGSVLGYCGIGRKPPSGG